MRKAFPAVKSTTSQHGMHNEEALLSKMRNQLRREWNHVS